MNSDTAAFQTAGLKFLYDMEMVHDPQLINNLKFNMFAVSRYVRDAELLSSYEQRAMLVWLDLSWIGRKFFKETIERDALDRLQQLLPRFKFRVTSDRAIMDLALAKLKAIAEGVKQ